MIKSNKRAMTIAGEKSKKDLNKMTKQQLELYFRSKLSPTRFP